MATLEELKIILQSLAGNEKVMIVFSVSLDGQTESAPAPAPAPAPALVKFKIDASSEGKARVKVRTEPSPAVGGPTLDNGTIVLYTGHAQTAYGVAYKEIITSDAVPLRGWVKSKYLIAL